MSIQKKFELEHLWTQRHLKQRPLIGNKVTTLAWGGATSVFQCLIEAVLWHKLWRSEPLLSPGVRRGTCHGMASHTGFI